MLCTAAAWASGAADISSAEKLVFLDPHLKSAHPPAVLHYTLEETAPGAPIRREDLNLALKARPDGTCCATTPLTAQDNSFGPLPPVEDATANPVILYFLEREVRQMQTLTGGQTNYFRRLIRLALAQSAKVSDLTITYAGHPYPAHEVQVTPYVDDPRRAQYAALAGKTYVFDLSPEMPGGVYQLRATVPGAAPGDAAVQESVLTFADASADAAGASPSAER